MQQDLVPSEKIEERIFFIRGKRVMLDSDLAKLYGVTTKALLQAVRRNALRFPSDFMYLTVREEVMVLRSQFVTSKKGRGGRRNHPYVFTQEGVAMLSSILHSKRAILVNIQIMRAFVRLREMLATHKELAFQFKELERKVGKQGEDIQTIFRTIQRLMAEPEKPKAKFGFHP